MRIAKVIGTVTLNKCHPSFVGATLKMVVPMSLDELVGRQGRNQCGAAAPVKNRAQIAANSLITDLGKAELQSEFVVAWDQLGAGIGDMIALSEGPEASMPFRPEIKPVGAYNAAILEHLEVDPEILKQK